MPAQLLIAYLAVTVVAVFLAQRLADAKQRSATGWMWTAALFPPLVSILAPMANRTTPSGVAI